MDESYKEKFIDDDFFDRIAQYRKGTFNLYREINKLQNPYTISVKLKDAFPNYKNTSDLVGTRGSTVNDTHDTDSCIHFTVARGIYRGCIHIASAVQLPGRYYPPGW